MVLYLALLGLYAHLSADGQGHGLPEGFLFPHAVGSPWYVGGVPMALGWSGVVGNWMGVGLA